jgi:hypothetical protein
MKLKPPNLDKVLRAVACVIRNLGGQNDPGAYAAAITSMLCATALGWHFLNLVAGK